MRLVTKVSAAFDGCDRERCVRLEERPLASIWKLADGPARKAGFKVDVAMLCGSRKEREMNKLKTTAEFRNSPSTR